MKYSPVRSVVINRVSLMVVLLCILLAGCESEPAVTPTAVQPSPPVVGQVTAVSQPTAPPTASPTPPTTTPTITTMPATATATNTAVPPTATATASPLPPSSTPTTVPVVMTETPPTVTAEPPSLLTSFTLTPTRATRGGTITLNWESEDGIRAELCTIVNQEYPERHSCEEVGPTGSKVVVVEPDATFYHFQLEVNGGGYTTYRDLYGCIDVSDWFFENPPDSCAVAPPVHTYAAAQRFEHGMMVWIEASDEFIIFYDENRLFTIHYPPLKLKPGASVDNRVGGAPAGYFEPVSGFGLIWRGEVENTDSVRSLLGWAIEPEFGFETIYQRGSEWGYRTLDRYIRDPEGKIIYFFNQAMCCRWWRYWEQVAG